MSLLCPWPAASLLLLALAAAPGPAPGVHLDVAGEVREADGRLLVRVDLTNRGAEEALAVQVEGELFGARGEAALPGSLAPGATRGLELGFPGAIPRPGVFALALHLRYVPKDAPGGARASQRAYLLLALGANPAPAVRLTVPDARLSRYAAVPVRLESADGAPHRVRLRALAPDGLNALPPGETIEVPAAGGATAALRVVRAGAPAGSEAGIVVLAAEVGSAVERTAVATGRVQLVAPPSPWLPRLRAPLLVAALALLAAAVGVELWWLRSRAA